MKIEHIKDTCTGCSACMSVCPTKSITMRMDAEGFYYPTIDHETCISCGKCDRTCHCLNKQQREGECEHVSYYGRSREMEVLQNSSSGGAFYHLAQQVLKTGGVVYGAAFDYQDLLLKHQSTDAVDLNKLLKSKYIESDLGSTIQEICAAIQNGRKVFFCGTPCQVRGVKSAVKDPQGLLLTCDFICHGVPSAKIFKEHLQHICKNENIVDMDFRPKEIGWVTKNLKVVTDKRTKVIPYRLDSYYRGFIVDDAFLRRSCYDCQYRKNHFSDITIADFWGYRNYKPEINDEKGWSLIVANTSEGQRLVENMEGFELNKLDNQYSDYIYAERDYSEAKQKRKVFFDQYGQHGFEKAAKKTYMKDAKSEKIKYYIKKILKRV